MNKILISVASWEDRFMAGFTESVKEWQPDSVILFYYKGYEDRTLNHRTNAKEICAERSAKFNDYTLDFFQPKSNWLLIKEVISSLRQNGSEVLIDITTMPRDTIWTVCYFLNNQGFSEINYVYFKAESYSKSWLSRDPGKPRLLYKMSGISQIGLPTLLIVFPGVDFQRVLNLINYFEPQKIIAGLHSGNLHLRNEKVVQDYLKVVNAKGHYEEFLFDSFNLNTGFELVESYVRKYKRDFNILISSLGPKTSALIAYEIIRTNPEVGLCYIPCKEYNAEYSKGTNGKITGTLSQRILEDTF